MAWQPISNPGSVWSLLSSKWYDVYLQNTFINYSVAILALILGAYTYTLDGGRLIDCAEFLISSIYNNCSSVAKVNKRSFSSSLGSDYRHETYYDYAVYKGNDYYLGLEQRFFQLIEM